MMQAESLHGNSKITNPDQNMNIVIYIRPSTSLIFVWIYISKTGRSGFQSKFNHVGKRE